MTGIEYCKASKEDIYKELVKAEDKIRRLKCAINSYYGMHEIETRGSAEMLSARYLVVDALRNQIRNKELYDKMILAQDSQQQHLI